MDYKSILEDFRREGRLREIPPHRAGRGLLDLSGNDYMGLAARQTMFRQGFSERFPEISMSASASRLLASDQRIFGMLENRLEDLYGRPALLFNSGYHANVGTVSALNIPGTLFLPDRLIHASAIDGLVMRNTQMERWRHNDTDHLRRIVEKRRGEFDRIIVMAESVYSMDGDIAPLEELVALRREFPEIMLYIDEAHAFGVFGEKGLGVAESLGLIDETDIIVGTFGKACASSGAFVSTSATLRDYLVNAARSLIFSTAIPPVCAAWSLMMSEILEDMSDERARLAEISAEFRGIIEDITGKECVSRSQIVPLMAGDATKAVKMSHRLGEQGVIALAIRRPTVPPGGERIRFSLNAGLSDSDIHKVADIIRKL